MIKAVLFDLDGTLVDTLGDIASVLNEFLSSKSWPTHPLEAYRMMVGRGLSNLIRTAVPPEQAHRADELYPEVFAAYETLGVGDSRPYPGATEALEALSGAGLALAVVSNKPNAIAKKVVETLFPGIRFCLVLGGRDGTPPKPDAAMALEAAQACGASPLECAFVGDSDVDMRTAVAAGMLPVGAAWGFRGEAELLSAGATVIARAMADIPRLIATTHAAL